MIAVMELSLGISCMVLVIFIELISNVIISWILTFDRSCASGVSNTEEIKHRSISTVNAMLHAMRVFHLK